LKDKGKEAAKVIPIDVAKEGKAGSAGKARKESAKKSEKKWGKAVISLGFCIVPSMLFRAQARLGLDSRQLNVIMHLADHWWDAHRAPYPGKRTIAARMSMSPRQVQRCLAALEQAGLVKRVARVAPQRGQMSNEYDLSGLVARLKALEPEFRKQVEDAKAKKGAVEKPGGGRRAATGE